MAETVVITGANRGIGLGLARVLTSRGSEVVALVRRPETASELAEIARRTGRVRILNCDVVAPDALGAAAAEIARPVDLLICNAGQFQARGGIDDPDHTVAAWSQTLMTNVAGVFFTVRAFLPWLAAAKPARVAVISSLMGATARAPGGAYIYRASKAAATNLARNLATDLAERGISVGAYHPGWVRTEMGGTAAPVSVEESAAGLVARFDALSLATTGAVEDFEGTPLPY
ncbi:MAG: SDR family oxidoreductase [Pikeienuella sp.]